ncbi:MAG: LacI family DNA-binding transcriptional regulator [Lachnospiraceae bacterium]|nr:LacI family DNA-binding transcriptional regulator [Lachnospiraceae bacterium]
MNIYDIAKMSGVSIATVSRVMNNNPKVSEKTKAKVMEAIEKSGYTPNVFAQGLGLKSMRTIGILVPSIADLYMSRAVAYIEDNLHDAGYDCILHCSGYTAEEKETHIQLLLNKKIDAMILVGSTYAGSEDETHNTDYIRKAAENVPVFIINGLVDGDNIYCTASNDYQASYDVTTALIESGRNKILFLTDSRSYSANQKKKGYKQALSNAGIKSTDDLMVYTENSIPVVKELLENIKINFDSVFTTDDAMAVGAIKYALSKGLKIPEDISIIGYNNSTMCICSEPELSSVDNKIEKVCKDTCTRLIDTLKGAENVPNQSVVACSLVKRATTDF